MGYTHYISNKPAFSDAQWKAFTKDVQKLLRETNIPVAGPAGERGTRPLFSRDSISFNGVDEDSHETCFVDKGPAEFEFCKTARKPYDPLVVAVFKLVRKYLPSTELTSDGGAGVFGNVVVVEAPNGKRLTYLAGENDVKVGDLVLLPALPHGDGYDWTATVIATESDYEGEMKEIVEVVESHENASKSSTEQTLLDEITDIIEEYGISRDEANQAADHVIGAVIARLKK